MFFLFFFFFQAEDGIRDPLVTGVQTCALPICGRNRGSIPSPVSLIEICSCDAVRFAASSTRPPFGVNFTAFVKIGRASCRERCSSRWPPDPYTQHTPPPPRPTPPPHPPPPRPP